MSISWASELTFSPCWASTAMIGPAICETSSAGSRVTSGASSARKMNSSSTTMNSTERFCTSLPWPLLEAWLSTAVTSCPARCVLTPGRRVGVVDGLPQAGDEGGGLGARAGGDGGEHPQLVGLPVGRPAEVLDGADAVDGLEVAGQPVEVAGVGRTAVHHDDGDGQLAARLERRPEDGRLRTRRAGRQEVGAVALHHAGQRRQERDDRGGSDQPDDEDEPAEPDAEAADRGEDGVHGGLPGAANGTATLPAPGSLPGPRVSRGAGPAAF